MRHIHLPLPAPETLGIPSSLAGSILKLGTDAAPNTSPGGANQRASPEGYVGETLFNGMWRMIVKSVTPMSRHNALESGKVSMCSLVDPGVAGRLLYRRRW